MQENLEKLLKDADRTGATVTQTPADLADIVRKRAQRRRSLNSAAAIAAAAGVIFAIAILSSQTRQQQPSKPMLANRPQPRTQQEPVSPEEIRRLADQTQATANFVRDVLADDRARRRLAQLKAKLAAIPDPMKTIRKEVDETAYILLRTAERMRIASGSKGSARACYNRVIELFSDSHWADVARQRLTEMQTNGNHEIQKETQS